MAVVCVRTKLGNMESLTNFARSRQVTAFWRFAPLLVVFVVWGSTFAAIKIALQTFPPFALGAFRMCLAALLLFGFATLRGARLMPVRGEWSRLAMSGVLYWLLGNGLLILAVERAPSGLVAVAGATMPMFALVLFALRNRTRVPTRAAVLSAIGVMGVAMMSSGALAREDAQTSVALGLVFALAGALAWAAGGQLPATRLNATASAAWQLTFASIGFAIASGARGEVVATPTATSISALIYLVVFGSAITFVCYLRALETLPRQLVLTHATINPLVAVAVGAFFLGESLDTNALIGGALVLLAVAFHSAPRSRRHRGAIAAGFQHRGDPRREDPRVVVVRRSGPATEHQSTKPYALPRGKR